MNTIKSTVLTLVAVAATVFLSGMENSQEHQHKPLGMMY